MVNAIRPGAAEALKPLDNAVNRERIFSAYSPPIKGQRDQTPPQLGLHAAANSLEPPDAIEVLKSLNNAVHSRRIFPAGSPQIKSAQERALSRLRLYLAENPLFTLALGDGKPVLSDQPVSEEVLDGIPNLILYRQLRLLQQTRLCLWAGFDETELASLMDILAAKVEDIRQEGGGGALIRRHGLEKFFSTADTAAGLTMAPPEKVGARSLETPNDERLASGHFLDKLPVKQEYLDYLLEKNDSARHAAQILKLLRQPEEGGKLLAACLATIVNELLKKRRLRESRSFITILSRVLALTPEDRQGDLLRAAAGLLADLLPAKALAICFVQDDKPVAGARLRDNLLRTISLDKFGKVIAFLRGWLEKLKRQRGNDDAETRLTTQIFDALLASGRGKQYLGHEKARALLENGELERKKKRVRMGLAALRRGDLALLDSEEMLALLPWIVRKLVAQGRQRDVTGLLRRVTSRIEQRDHPVSPSLGHRLVEIVNDLWIEKQEALLVQAIEPLRGCLVALRDAPACASVACTLSRLMQMCWESGQMAEGDSILRLFDLIRGGKIVKPTEAALEITQAADNGIPRETIKSFFEECLKNPGDREMDQRLVMLGPVAGRFLIEWLIRSEKTTERLRIIDLLFGDLSYLPGIILERLAEPMPWYGKRNLLKLLAENGDASHIEPVFAFLRHDDLRVQREAFLCLYKISGSRRRDTLLRVLSMASEDIRLQAVKALLPYADKTVVAVASQIIDEREVYSPAVHDQLLIAVCQLLARCPPGDSIAVLNDFLELRDQKGGRGVGEAVWREAENTLRRQRENLANHKKRHAQTVGQRKMALRRLSRNTQALPLAKLAVASADERTIAHLLAAGDREEAGRVFLDAITRLTQQADIAQATSLRRWFGERQPNDLPVVNKAKELIDAVGGVSVEKSHLEVWADFYDGLTTEEFNAFHQALTHCDYRDEEVITRQGKEVNGLYMINSGRVKIIYHDSESADRLTQNLTGGELLAAGNFLDAATWPMTAVSVGPSNLSRFRFDRLAAWDEEQPELARKVRAFAARFVNVDGTLRKSGQDDELVDLSRQGLSLRIGITSKRKAGQLPGRDATFPMARAAATPPTPVTDGKITAVRELQDESQAETKNSLRMLPHTPIGEQRLVEILKLRDKLQDS